MTQRVQRAFRRELLAARTAEQQREVAAAWRALERAHILGQRGVAPHLRAHVAMAGLAWRERDWRELLGQVPRLILAAPGSWFDRAPRGNTGRSNVGIFTPMDTPADLAAILRDSG